MRIADQNLRVHFVGIGGIGVSALARYYLAQGARVTGSDLVKSEIVDELRDQGIMVSIGHASGSMLPGTNLVIYSPAIKRGNPELITARELKTKIMSYPQALGALTKKYFTIAVSGSHGKSTTTALISLILAEAGLDPTVIIGTKLREFNNKNFRKGESQYLVIEADEWNKSFHNYYPKVIALTNIDKEHLDTYKNFRGVVAGFSRYLKNLPKDGVLVANWKDQEIRKLAMRLKKAKRANVIFYSKGNFKKHPLSISGAHNQINAEAAWQTARHFGIKKSVADKVFKSFEGAWRRMEFLGFFDEEFRIMDKTNVIQDSIFKIRVYSDYGHHPTEIKATLQALRERYKRPRIICIFQPHQQDRLTRLFKDFVGAFDAADAVILMPVYKVAGREEKSGTDSFALAQTIKRHKSEVFFAPDFDAAIKTLRSAARAGDVAVFMSAGDLDSQLRKFLF